MSDRAGAVGRHGRWGRISAMVLATLLAAGAGVATAWRPSYAAMGAGAALFLLVLALIYRAVRPRTPATPGGPRSAVPFLLLCYLLPVLALSRLWSKVGHNPVYVPDVIAAITAAVALTRASWRRLGLYAALSLVLFLLVTHSVEVGLKHHYFGAIKGMVLAVYPMVAMCLAGWLTARADLDRLISFLPRFILPLVPIGMIIAHSSGGMVPSSYGLNLGVSGSFVAVRGTPRRRLLTVTFLVGAIILLGFSAKRGVTITLAISFGAAWLANKRLRSVTAATVAGLGALTLAGLFALVVVTGIYAPTNAPVIGRLVARASGQTAGASGNVALREHMWAYALTTSWDNDPLLGVGAYHPIGVDYKNLNVASKALVGVHDSFIGYTFYAGYPAGIIVLFLFCWGLVRCWRYRRRSIYCPVLFGALVAAILTAATNVALEVTYVGGPSWLILGLAFAVTAKIANDDEDRARAAAMAGEEQPAEAGEPVAAAPLLHATPPLGAPISFAPPS